MNATQKISKYLEHHFQIQSWARRNPDKAREVLNEISIYLYIDALDHPNAFIHVLKTALYEAMMEDEGDDEEALLEDIDLFLENRDRARDMNAEGKQCILRSESGKY